MAVDGGGGMPPPIRTLATGHLWRLKRQLEPLINQVADGAIDEYSLVHLNDLLERINRALNAVQVTGVMRQRIELGGIMLGF